MKALLLFLLFLLCSCSISRYAVTGKCATTPTLVTDVVIASAGLAGSVGLFNDENEPALSLALFAAAMSIALSANIAETVCR